MNNFAKVVDGTVTEIGELPETGWITNKDGERVGVSNFPTLPRDVLAKEGWLPLFDESPIVDNTLYDVAQNSYEIRGDHVVALYDVTPKPAYLMVDQYSIPADGQAEATVTYCNAANDAPDPVTFTVNGEQITVDLTDGKAVLTVSTVNPGPVEIDLDALPTMNVIITAEKVLQ